MKKNIFKKAFIRISKLMGFELIDQNEFYSPTLNKEINENLTNLNKSIVFPLGEVELSRKVSSLMIIFRCNTNIDIWDQNKKRIFEKNKIEYTLRSLNSLIRAINYFKKNESLNIKLFILDNGSDKKDIKEISDLVDKNKVDYELIIHENNDFKSFIKEQKTEQTFSNLSSLFKCFKLAKEKSDDLIFFVEDDYLHFETLIEEMINTYERISSQLKRDLFICPSDYPYLYMNNQKTNILIGNKRHWRIVDKSLCTFLTSKKLIEQYWSNFEETCKDRHEPFEKKINEIYKKEFCISPIQSLSVHFTNVNSSYGLSPFVDYKSLWDSNSLKND
ncbi:MAG: glycosyltransferase group 2 [Candidatus Pelagibacter sp. TMED273]|nr:MAG: glycosyltransferase group 2 [Candidatus Pelagibacter sp. TMED273]|tara:strand:+ start:10551 stop:11546 length:996 start_codon:yes stop_codon:yes gene_type:complete